MTTQTFNLRAPHTCAPQRRLKLKEFPGGEGFTQVVPDGINFVRTDYSVSWRNLTQTEYDAIVNFFIANAGKSFFFNVPNATSGNPVRVRCNEWVEDQTNPSRYDISTTFKQEYV